MKRPARLQSAVSWLRKFEGKNILRSYCKHFGVDWRCAAIELKQLGIQVDADYLKRRELSERQVANARRLRREKRAIENSPSERLAYETELDAYLAGDFPALYAMECERDGIEIDWSVRG